MNLRSRLVLGNLLLLQILDVLSTNNVLANEGAALEANPVMAAAQAEWGGLWWLPKAFLMLFVIALASYVRSLPPRTSLCVVFFYALIVINNIERFI